MFMTQNIVLTVEKNVAIVMTSNVNRANVRAVFKKNQNLVVYPVLSTDPGRCVEANNWEKSCDLKPTDEQLLICDQISRQRATCKETEIGRGGEEKEQTLVETVESCTGF